MKTHVCGGYELSTVLKQVDEAKAGGINPTLALVFCSVAHDFRLLGSCLSERGMAVVGVTTAGEIADGEVLNEACVVMLLEMKPEAFAVHFQSAEDAETLATLGERLGAAAIDRFAHPVVLAFASGVTANGEEVVQGIRTGAGRTFPLYGGMAGDGLRMENTYVFSGEGATARGLIGLVLDGDRIEVEGLTTSGWQPVGVAKTITRSEGNRVYTIDDKPALDVYAQYLGQPEIMMEAVGVQYPLSVKRTDGTAVIRAPIYYDAEGEAVIFAGSVPEHASARFCIPPSVDIVAYVLEEAGEMKQRLPNADALILVDCIARHLALGMLSEEEIQGLHDLWKAPLAGFFSYGEIGAERTKPCDFHTETCVLLALRERE